MSSPTSSSSTRRQYPLVASQIAVFLLFLSFAIAPESAFSDITVQGANGSDNALNLSANTVIDLGQAVLGNWDDNNAANAGKGIYDSNKWAVVFKYSSVTIGPNAVVTFKNHPSRAPVVWLVSGDVVINGRLDLSGQAQVNVPLNAEPGPGGFRGGSGFVSIPASGGSGFGIGGGAVQVNRGDNSSLPTGATYGTLGGNGTPLYGNPSLLPLIGGSGGSGTDSHGDGYVGHGGGAGGGAILIAAQGSIAVGGVIQANGGNGKNPVEDNERYSSGCGSGGGIRLVCSKLQGIGQLLALPGTPTGWPGTERASSGGLGRIRIERFSNANQLRVVPDPSVVDLTDGSSALLWPPSGAPSVRVVSVGGTNAPVDPRAGFATVGADVTLPLVASTQVVVETTNVEKASQVIVRCTPKFSANYFTTNASIQATISTDPLVLRWAARVPVGAGYSAVQAQVIRP